LRREREVKNCSIDEKREAITRLGDFQWQLPQFVIKVLRWNWKNVYFSLITKISF
jgi:hypothetical protein